MRKPSVRDIITSSEDKQKSGNIGTPAGTNVLHSLARNPLTVED